jgi:hypothetical protein
VSSDSTWTANPLPLPNALVGVCGALIAIGVVAFLGGLAADSDTAWRAFHVNQLYFGILSQGALCVSCAFVIIGAKWCGPIRHVSEALAAWVPISFVLFIVGDYFGREAIYTNWIHGPPPGKEAWLTFQRVYFTNIAVMGVMTVLTLVYLRASFRPSLKAAAENAPRARALFERWTANWRGDDIERDASQRRLKLLAPIIALGYAFGFSIITFDQIMSLNPTWFSNIFGWYVLWGGFLSGIAATALGCVILRATVPGWDVEITKPRMHDLGKMCFAFSIFWMYLFFAQYIVIWYGNLPEETQFFTGRLGSQFLQDTWLWAQSRLEEPYVRLSLTAWVGIWIIPFWVLLGQRPKRTPAILGSVAAILLLGFWLERNALVWPALVPDDGMSWLGPIQVGIALGFLGAFVMVVAIFSRVFPTLPLPRD